MNWEEAAIWWALGFGCGLLVMLGLVIWERWSRASKDPAVEGHHIWNDMAYEEYGEPHVFPPNQRELQDHINNSLYGEPDAPGPPKVVAIPKRKKKPAAKKSR